MKKIPCLVFALALVLVLVAPIPASSQDPVIQAPEATSSELPDPEALRTFLADYVPVEMEKADIPGAAVVVVQGGRVVLAEGYGFADLESGRRVDPETSVFRLGSLSKPVTATTILALLERLDFDLDRDVRPLLEGLVLEPEYGTPITLRQLLTHGAGFNENLFGQHVARPESWLPLDEYLERRLPPRFAPPGKVIAYTDFHTSLAGLVASRLAQLPFESLAESLLFQPLGMERSSFRQVDLPQTMTVDLARSYRRVGDRLVPYARDYVRTTPAAGLQGTATDMGRYLIALLDTSAEAGTVMSAASWQEQKKIHFRQHPRLPGKALGLTEVRHGGRVLLYKNGQASGFYARILLVPDAEVGLFSVHNRSVFGPMGAFNAATAFHRELGWKLIDELLPEVPTDPTAPPVAATGANARLAAYEGTYRNTVASRHTAEKLISMMDSARVRRTGGDGELAIGSGRYVEIEPGLLQWYEGGAFYAAFAPPVAGASPYLFLGAGAYERIPWYETDRASIGFIATFVLVFLLGAVSFGWKCWSLRRSANQRVLLSALASAVFNLAFLTGWVCVFALADVQFLFQGWPWTVKGLLALPLLALLPLAYLGRSLFDRERWSQVSRFTRALAGLLVVANLAFLAWLHLWNLLGWRL